MRRCHGCGATTYRRHLAWFTTHSRAVHAYTGSPPYMPARGGKA